VTGPGRRRPLRGKRRPLPGARWPLRVLVAGMVLSRSGDAVASLGLVLDASRMGTPWGVTAVFLADLVPPVLCAPLLGRVADRWDARSACLAGLALQAGLFLAAAAIPHFGVRVALVAVASICGVLANAAAFKLLPAVAGGRVQQANSLVTGGSSLAGIVGPPAAGVVYAAAGSTVLLAANGISFTLLAAAVLAGVPGGAVPGEGRPPAAAEQGAGHDGDAGAVPGAWAGSAVVRRVPVLACLMPTLAAVVLGTSLEGVAGVFYLLDVVSGDDAAYGLLLACWALGSLPGAAWPARPRYRTSQPALTLTGALLLSGGLLVTGLVPVPAVVAVAFLVGGFGNGVHNAALRNVIHTYVPPDHHARAWAYYSLTANVCITAGFVLGTPWGPVSSQVLVVLAGALPLAATLLGMRSLASLTARNPTATAEPNHRIADPSR
jgi:MFS family permease